MVCFNQNAADVKLSLARLSLKEVCDFRFLGAQLNILKCPSHMERELRNQLTAPPELPANSQNHRGCFNPVKALDDYSSTLVPHVENLPAGLKQPRVLRDNK